MDNGITPVMPIGNYGDGFGGNSFMWIFALIILMGMFNGNGFGWGNNNVLDNLATENSMQRGFDNQNSMANQREILQAVTNGTAQSVQATNQTFHDTLAVLNDKYSELQRDVGNLAVGQANALANQNACCCDTKMLIQSTAADTNAQIAQNKYDTSMQMAQMEARLTAKMDANEIQSLRDKVQSLELQNATSNVLRYPNSWTYNGGYFPPLYGCGCQQNI